MSASNLNFNLQMARITIKSLDKATYCLPPSPFNDTSKEICHKQLASRLMVIPHTERVYVSCRMRFERTVGSRLGLREVLESAIVALCFKMQ